MNAKNRHSRGYKDYLFHLESVLKKASQVGKALVFRGHD
jgi:hypothetical protein